LFFESWHLYQEQKDEKNKNQKKGAKFLKVDWKKKSTTELKYLKEIFKFNSLFFSPTKTNYEKEKNDNVIIDLAWESLSKNLEANWNFFLFLSLPVQFLTTEKKPILLEMCVNPLNERKKIWMRE